jgi:hypothetical protein
MTRDDIIRMAREAGVLSGYESELFQRFAALVAKAERKRLTDAEQKCVVLNCTNHKSEGKFQGDLCAPCYVFVSTGKGVYSQAYRNTQRQPLTDEEIAKLLTESAGIEIKINDGDLAFARAIERAHGIGEKE